MASWSGVGRYTTGLARALAERADVELIQVCLSGEDPPVPPGFLVRAETALSSPFTVRGALELSRLARRTSPHILHCPHFPTPLPIQTPLVVTLHDLTPLMVPEAMPNPLKRSVYRIANKRATSLADKVIVPSESTAVDVSRLFPNAKDRLVITPEAADDFAGGTAAPLSGALAGLTASPYLLSMGNTRPHKDMPTLLRAFGILAPSFPDLRLLLVGQEPDGYLQSQLRRVPIDVAGRVSFTGKVSDAELRSLCAGATLFVFPSRYEGFGLPVLEAMALGAPVVCASAASLPEVAGDAALLFPPGEQGQLATTIARVLRDPGLRRRLVEAGRSRAAKFKWSDTAAATVAVYSSVLEDRGTSALGWVDR
jgi:glycosyltransferase involved in cell wall biosynthesis